jgi:hypothetical protein
VIVGRAGRRPGRERCWPFTRGASCTGEALRRLLGILEGRAEATLDGESVQLGSAPLSFEVRVTDAGEGFKVGLYRPDGIDRLFRGAALAEGRRAAAHVARRAHSPSSARCWSSGRARTRSDEVGTGSSNEVSCRKLCASGSSVRIVASEPAARRPNALVPAGPGGVGRGPRAAGRPGGARQRGVRRPAGGASVSNAGRPGGAGGRGGGRPGTSAAERASSAAPCSRTAWASTRGLRAGCWRRPEDGHRIPGQQKLPVARRTRSSGSVDVPGGSRSRTAAGRSRGIDVRRGHRGWLGASTSASAPGTWAVRGGEGRSRPPCCEAWHSSGKTLVPLMDGGYAPLPAGAGWSEHGALLQELLEARDARGRVHRNATAALVELLEDTDADGPARPQPPAHLPRGRRGPARGVRAARGLSAELRPYQLTGVPLAALPARHGPARRARRRHGPRQDPAGPGGAGSTPKRPAPGRRAHLGAGQLGAGGRAVRARS